MSDCYSFPKTPLHIIFVQQPFYANKVYHKLNIISCYYMCTDYVRVDQALCIFRHRIFDSPDELKCQENLHLFEAIRPYTCCEFHFDCYCAFSSVMSCLFYFVYCNVLWLWYLLHLHTYIHT